MRCRRYFRRRRRRYRVAVVRASGVFRCPGCDNDAAAAATLPARPMKERTPPSTGGDHLTRKRKRARVCGSASRQTRIHSEETTGTACGDSTMATSKTEN